MKQNFNSQAITAYLFLAPALILLLIFTFYPIIYGSYLGFTEYKVVDVINKTAPRFIGFDNFVTLWQDDLFKTSLVNSLKYLLIVPALQIGSLAAAVLVNRAIPGIELFRAAFYIPVITSISLAAVMWDWIYNKEGTLNWILQIFHLVGKENTIGWLNEPSTAFWAIMLVTFWRGFGYYMVLYMAGLQSIPGELEEAARLDGATPFQVFWLITVPMMKPTLLLCSLLSSIAALRVLEEVMVLTQGGPLNSTYTALYYVYSRSLQRGFDGDYGLASAAGLVVAVVAMLLSYINFKYFSEGSSAS